MILELLTNFINSVLPFLVILTILVFVHELGHYTLARMNNVKVEVFSIGFGKELFGLPGGSLLCRRARFLALCALHILTMVEIILLVLRTEFWLWQKLSASSTAYSLASFT